MRHTEQLIKTKLGDTAAIMPQPREEAEELADVVDDVADPEQMQDVERAAVKSKWESKLSLKSLKTQIEYKRHIKMF